MNKTYYSTFKAGKEAWTTGSGWSKFFMLLIGSVMATFALKSVAELGKQLASQAAAKMANAEKAGEQKGDEGGKSGEDEHKESGDNKGEVKVLRSEKSNVRSTLKSIENSRRENIEDMQSEGDKCPPPKVERRYNIKLSTGI